MKPFKIKKNSWHYKLNAKLANDYSMTHWEAKHFDFCSYWRATIARLLMVAFLIAAAIFFLFLIALAFYSDPVMSLSVVGAAILVIGSGVCFGVVSAWFSIRNHHKPSKPDSLFMQKYKAHKEKICPMVEYEDV